MPNEVKIFLFCPTPNSYYLFTVFDTRTWKNPHCTILECGCAAQEDDNLLYFAAPAEWADLLHFPYFISKLVYSVAHTRFPQCGSAANEDDNLLYFVLILILCCPHTRSPLPPSHRRIFRLNISACQSQTIYSPVKHSMEKMFQRSAEQRRREICFYKCFRQQAHGGRWREGRDTV